MSAVGSFLLEPEPHPDLDLSRIGDIGRLAKERRCHDAAVPDVVVVVREVRPGDVEVELIPLVLGAAAEAVVPMLGAVTATALSVLLYPVRRPLHRFTSGLLLRAAENKEPIGYVVAFLTVLAATTAAAGKTWSWMFGG
jgi:hypothetical protein